MTFLENQDVRVMDWPAKSPDMNHIKHIWDKMAIHIRDMDNLPATQQQLRGAVMAVWDALGPERLRSLVRSMLFKKLVEGTHVITITRVAKDLSSHLTKI